MSWKKKISRSGVLILTLAASASLIAGGARSGFAQQVALEPTLRQVAPAGRANFADQAAGQPASPRHPQQQIREHGAPPPTHLPPSLLPAAPDNLPPLGVSRGPEPAGVPQPGVVIAPLAGFDALDDNNTLIPPDTNGAVGPQHLISEINSERRVHLRSGASLGTTSLATFWTSGTGISLASIPFDPHTLYVPQLRKWISVAVADAASATSRLLVAISDGVDPTGTWTFYEFDADSANVDWADYPVIGYNKNWLTIGMNMFAISGGYSGFKMWALSLPDLDAAGVVSTTVFPTGFVGAAAAAGCPYTSCETFTLYPAITHDPHEETLHLVAQDWFTSGAGHLFRLATLTGTPDTPVFTLKSGGPFPGTGLFPIGGTWGFQIRASQIGTAGGVGSHGTNLVETNDPRTHGAVFRNGVLYTTHSIGLPAATAFDSSSVDRTGIFWAKIDPTLAAPVIDHGVLMGGADTHYFFPSLAVNRNDEMLLGFAYSDGTTYPGARAAGRGPGTAPGLLGPVTTIIDGLDFYAKDFGGPEVRWGDYSKTWVDPVDDETFWTIQMYAHTDVGGGTSDDRWRTRWYRGGLDGFTPFVGDASSGAETDATGTHR